MVLQEPPDFKEMLVHQVYPEHLDSMAPLEKMA